MAGVMETYTFVERRIAESDIDAGCLAGRGDGMQQAQTAIERV
jgi:hypothetical protein